MKLIKNFLKITTLILLFAIASCKKNNDVIVDPPPLPNAPLTAQSTNDVAYGTDALQKFDMVLPAGRTTATTKVLIIIHGGSWSAGDKADMTAYVNAMKISLPNYAFFNLNYRLASTSGTNLFPTQENDVKAAVDFINSKRAEYNISDKISLLGASAGAHLALLQAYKYATPKIRAVVDLYGPTDMSEMYNNPATSVSTPGFVASIGLLTSGVFGGNPTTHTAAFNASSPIRFVTAQSPPTIMFHGGIDAVVRYQQSTALDAKLAQFGVVKQYVFYPFENHAYMGPSLDDTFIKSIAFLNANVQ